MTQTAQGIIEKTKGAGVIGINQLITRTAHRYMPKQLVCSFGDGLEHGINEVCRCCKSKGVPIGGAELEPFKQFYKTREYKAYKCPACGYLFSWYK